MVTQVIRRVEPCTDECAETDGLLEYLRTLYRVAHAPDASHWCTPGHNRGRSLGDGAAATVPLAPFLFPVGEEAR